jgi:hypothetical protein
MRAVALSLQEARQQAAKRLDEQVARAVREPEPDRRRLVDKREIRGWPAAGRGICGAIGGSSPGSDEHLDRLDE